MKRQARKAMTAEERLKKALHQLDVDYGNGRFDYAKIRAILAGGEKE